MDVGDWLRSLGLSQYEALFRQNDIDAEVLNELTDDDLEKVGVSLGPQALAEGSPRWAHGLPRPSFPHLRPLPRPSAANSQ